MTHALLIGGFKSVIEAAKSLGIRLTVVDRPGKLASGMDAMVERVIVTNYLRDAALMPMLDRIHDVDPLDTVLSFTEAGLMRAVEISEALKLMPSVPRQVVERTRFKARMRDVLAEAGLGVPSAAVSSAEEIVRFIDRFGAPVIVKPESGVASHGVFKVTAREDAAALEKIAPGDDNPSWIVEKFLAGPEFSVETFSFDGAHVVLSIHAKEKAGDGWPNPFVEVGHYGPAPLSQKDWDAVSGVVSRCLDAVDYRDGPSHTEVILTETGPQIVETHTRVGGDRISQLLKLCTGVEVYNLALNWMCFQRGEINLPPRRENGAAIRFFVGPPGRLISIEGIAAARKMPDVFDVELYKTEGETISELRGSEDRIGHVICKGATPQEARTSCKRIIESVVRLNISR